MKNKKAITLLLSANFISGIAQGISMISVPMYFAQEGLSNWFNIFYATITVVSLFWSLYGGTLIDQYNRKKIFIALNVFNGLAIAMIAFLCSNWTEALPFLAFSVFALTFWNYNLHYPCFYAFMQEISEAHHYKKIASYIEVQSQLASALAGAFAAVLLGGGIQLWGMGFDLMPWTLAEVFALDAFTYFIALFLILIMRYESVVKRTVEPGTVLQRLHNGYNYLSSNSYIFLFGVLTHSVFIVVLLHVFNLAPIYVEQHLGEGAQVFAISEIFYAAGAIFAGLYIHALFGKMPITAVIIVLMLVSVFEFLVMATAHSILLFYFMTFLLGLTNAGIRVLRMSFLFEVIPNAVMGRANSIFFLANVLSRIFFLSLFSLAFFHENGNVIYSFLILSGFMFVTASIMSYFYQPIQNIKNKISQDA